LSTASKNKSTVAIALAALAPLGIHAEESAPPARIDDDVVVVGRWDNPLGYGVSASQGVVGAAELDARPRLRTGEILEVVPGLIVTQHSGTGKSNQMFLRGFNLDHGTDFATWVDGMPVNLPTHAHGQGYTDVNFVIPELVETLEYRKGAYYAEVSDFSSAGAAHLTTYDRLPAGLVKTGVGEDGHLSALAADSVDAGRGDLLYGVQAHRYRGPWTDVDEDVRRNLLTLRYSQDGASGGWNVALMGYDAHWSSPDQVPQRAVANGLIDALGSIDPTLGGESSRYSMSGAWTGDLGSGQARANAYLIDYELDLFSNFTYFLDDADNGDQFNQRDDRTIAGGSFAYTFGESDSKHTFGASVRHDAIGDVGLYRTRAREQLATVRSDSVDELAVGFYYSSETHWSDKLRSVLGVRADHFAFDVSSNLPENSGSTDDSLLTPKASLIYTVGERAEVYASAGKGFHSNDARGTTITVDPVTSDPAETVDPLVSSKQIEVGFRTFVERRFNVSAALWLLELDSELLFVGDAGNTEASRPSRRYGLELPVYYRPNDVLTFDLELALTRSEFTDFDAVGDRIPGSIDRVIAGGITLRNPRGFYGAVRWRYFGPRPLIEDGSIESESSTVMNVEAGYTRGRFDVRLDLLNALDSNDDDIAYWYASRLPGEPDEGVEDYHVHPIEPRSARLYVSWKF
jgi:hypothetical protein